MADPATLGILTLSAASLGLTVASTVQASETAKAQAAALKEQGIEDEKLQRAKNARLRGSQRVAFAKSGVDLSSGTPLGVLAQSAEDAELNALRVKFGFDANAARSRAEGQQAVLRGAAGATSTLLGTVGALSQLPNKSKLNPFN